MDMLMRVIVLMALPVLSLIVGCVCGILPPSLIESWSSFLHYMRRTNKYTPIPKREFNFDAVQPGIYLGRQPRHLEDIALLQSERYNVSALVCMNMEWELFVPSSKFTTIEPTLARLHLPVSDFQAPSLAQIQEAMVFIQHHRSRGSSVYIHCNAGKGRSGVISVAYAMLTGANEIASAFTGIKSKRAVLSNSMLRYPFVGQARVLVKWQQALKKRAQ